MKSIVRLVPGTTFGAFSLKSIVLIVQADVEAASPFYNTQ